MATIRGIQQKHEHAAQHLARDTRPFGVRAAEFICTPEITFAIFSMSIVMLFVFPEIVDLLFFAGVSLYIFIYTRHSSLPFRMPRSSKSLDYNDLIPGTRTPKTAGGISFFGNDRITGEELWFNNDDLRTHVLIFGSTGSGKTEALVSIAFNSLLHGSGFIYVDGKGDNSLFAKIFSMTRRMGRDDDVLLINFMTGARDVIGPQENRLSNTMNPFASGSSSMISQLVTSLMDDSGSGSGGDMWKGRAINFVESLMKILCAMRDAGHILLDANSIREYFILEKLESMVVDKKFPINDAGDTVSIEAMPKEILEPLKNYVLNLPGYNPKKKGDQAGEVREQHGFITMQLTRVFGSLADTYGHIIRTNLAEVDLKDVVLNRRILVVLLPALEKSPDELANLGKVIIASLKAMMAAGLGDAIEGDYRDVILRKPTNAPSPYVCIMDEYGYYAVKGFAVVPAQARSLGFSAIFAGQDLPAFQKASKEEAASIGANCNIKICMKLEDPQETWEFFNKVAGEAYVTNVSGFQMDSGSVSLNYMDTKNASVDRRQRIDLLDLKDQREGESHVFFKSRIIRAEMFYANPKPVARIRINHFLKVEPPNEKELVSLDKRLRQFSKIFAKHKSDLPKVEPNEDITIIADALNKADNLQPFERGIAGLIAILENEVNKQRELSAPYESGYNGQNMSAFTKIEIDSLIQQMVGSENVELFSLPLIRRGSTLEELKHIERLSDATANIAQQIAMSVINEIETVTTYPPEILFAKDKAQMLQDINTIIQFLGGTPVSVRSKMDLLNIPGISEEDIDRALAHGEKVLNNLAQDPAHEHEVANTNISEAAAFPGLDSMKDLPDLPELPDLDQLDTKSLDSNDLEEMRDLPTFSKSPELPELAEFEALLKEHGIDLDQQKNVGQEVGNQDPDNKDSEA